MSKRHSDVERFIMLRHWVTRTEAWRDLDTVARCAYIEIATRYAGPGSNNGRIHCSLKEMAEALHVSKSTAMRALARLQDHGFLVEEVHGTFNIKRRHASEWRLTEWKNDITGDMATKDFARWKKQNTGTVVKPDGYSRDTARVLP